MPVQIVGAAVQPGRPFSPSRPNPHSLEDISTGIKTLDLKKIFKYGKVKNLNFEFLTRVNL